MIVIIEGMNVDVSFLAKGRKFTFRQWPIRRCRLLVNHSITEQLQYALLKQKVPSSLNKFLTRVSNPYHGSHNLLTTLPLFIHINLKCYINAKIFNLGNCMLIGA